ncbi:Acetyltransferase (isoleucine patch superfamily) [Sphingomonas sp. OV641]|nr:Acetyltransferase (isoleucine patch superfamily) [Sphingomonas sp. OV641]
MISAMISDRDKEAKLSGLRRSLQRHAIPAFLASPYFFIRDRARIHPGSSVQLSAGVRFGKGTVVKRWAIIQSSGGRITLGRNCAVGSFNHLIAGVADLIIGDDVRLGSHVTVVATTRDYRRKDRLITEQGFRDKGITIGDDVLIGSGAVVLDGCRIGQGAVIGAGSVVSGRIAPYSIVAGSPAKVVFNRE